MEIERSMRLNGEEIPDVTRRQARRVMAKLKCVYRSRGLRIYAQPKNAGYYVSVRIAAVQHDAHTALTIRP